MTKPAMLRSISRARTKTLVFLGLIGISTIFACNAKADALDEIVERTKVVGSVTIQSGTSGPKRNINPQCGYAYTATVREGILNAKEGETIEFRSELSMLVGGVYLLFLSDEVLSATESTASALGNIRSIRCVDSGVLLAPVQYRHIDTLAVGDEMVFELRRVFSPDNTNLDDLGTDVYSAPKRVASLFISAFPDEESGVYLELDVQRGISRSLETAIRDTELLELVASLVDKRID